MIYLTGDTHGQIDINKLAAKNWEVGKSLTKDDYLIVLGDFGLVWNGDKEEGWWTKWLSAKPWTTLFLDGNHENHDILDDLETVEMFGADVGKVEDSIYHLRRGRIYDIDGNKIFVLGGAESVDREHRSEGFSWWRQEAIDADDIILSLKNLEKVYDEVDYVLTHTCPFKVMYDFKIHVFTYDYGGKKRTWDPCSHQLQVLADKIIFKHWYFGHFHKDESLVNCFGEGKYTCLYDEIIPLGEFV